MDSETEPSFASLLNPWRAAIALFRQRGLLWQFAWRNLENRHRGTFLGVAWMILNPLLTLALYLFVFGYIFGGTFGMTEKETKWDYGLGIFLGLTIFHLLSESIAAAPFIVTSSPNFVKKVVFPLPILPAAAVGAIAIHTLVSLGMVVAGLVFSSEGLTWSVLLLPFILFPAILFALGCSWILSAVGVFFRDIGQVVSLLTMGLLFASAIFYPAEHIRAIPEAWTILRFNPLIHIIELSRDIALWHKAVSPLTVLILYASGTAFATFGYAIFAYFQRDFAEVI